MSENTNAVVVKKTLTWKVSEDMSYMTLEASNGRNMTFTFTDFWKTGKWERLEDVEKLCVINGLKQKLVDKIAASKDLQLSIDEKFKIIEETWKRLCENRQWNKPSEGRKAAVSKIDSALSKASEAELAMMLKLGLIDQKKYDGEMERRKSTEEENTEE